MIGRIRIDQTTEEDSTAVSNIFIDEYLADANDAEIKVYLYLLRMMRTGRATSVADLADHFNHTEKDIMRSLSYWEEQGLLGLEYDDTGRLFGIHIEDVRHRGDRADTVDTQLREALVTKPAPVNAEQAPARKGVTVALPSPSPLLFIAEQYFGRTLNPTEMELILRIRDDMHFSEDLLDYLLQHCAGRHIQDFRYVERVAVAWAEKGITTVEEARVEAVAHDPDTREILRALGIDTAPTDKELSYIMRWRQEYGFSRELIKEACDRTVLATGRSRIRYCDGILRSWHEKGVTSMEDVQRLDEAHVRAGERRQARDNRIDARNRFGQFAQSDSDYAALEQLVIES